MNLAAHDITVRRSGKDILRGVSLRLSAGEFVALIGPNGAGKSTLLEAMAGGGRVHGGSVSMDGRPLSNWPRQALARRRAVLPQAPELAFGFSVLDAVLLGRSPHNGGNHLDVVHAVLQAAGLSHLAQRDYRALSGGERQRVHLARALAQIWPSGAAAPGYLLLDEPTNNLDLAHQHGLLATARGLLPHNIGVLAVLHDPNLASQYADTLVLMADGQIQASGPPRHTLTSAAVAATFGIVAELVTHPRHGHPVLLPLRVSCHVTPCPIG